MKNRPLLPTFRRTERPSVLKVARTQIALLTFCAALGHAAEFKFAFGSGPMEPGYVKITPATAYDSKSGFGFLESSGAIPAEAQIFAVDVDEGNYDVTMRFGDPGHATSTTINAESRRLMIEKVDTLPGENKTQAFTVNVRKPGILSLIHI